MNDFHPIPEILAPAGNLDKFRTALLYGADAIYLGGETLNLRASCAGLDNGQLRLAVTEAAAQNARVYYCLNSFPDQDDLKLLPEVIEKTADAGVSAFIVADPGVLRLARRYAPQVPLHLSTQANTTNSQSVQFWLEQGVGRLNLARELSWRDIGGIRAACPEAELEIFTHGAMCLALSGQCLLSAWLNGRTANQGQCTQPCRFEYKARELTLAVEEALRPGLPLWEVREDENYSSFWAPDDLCLLPYLPWFISQGINCLKIEGRMKSAAYVAHVTDVYSSALKAAARASGPAGPADGPTGGLTASSRPAREPDPESAGPESPSYDHWPFLDELLHNSARPLTSGFFFPDKRVNITELAVERGLNAPGGKHSGVVARLLEPCGGTSGGEGHAMQADWLVEVKQNWDDARTVQLMLPGLKRPLLQPQSYTLENHRGEASSSVNCGTIAVLHFSDAALQGLRENFQADSANPSATFTPTAQGPLKPGIFIRHAGM